MCSGLCALELIAWEFLSLNFPSCAINVLWNWPLNLFDFLWFFVLFFLVKYTRVVPKLVLTLSGRTCNAIYWNSNGAYVFYSSLFFQQAPADACMSNISQVTAGFVKTVASTLPKKKKGKNEWSHKFIPLHHPRNPRLYIWHFLSWSTAHLLINMLPFFWPIFKNSGFKLLLRNVSKDHLDLLDHLGIFSKFQPRSSHFNDGNNLKSHGTRCRLYCDSFIALMLWCSSHSCTRTAVCSGALFWCWNHRPRSHIISMCSKCISFFTDEENTFPLTRSMLLKVEHSSHFFFSASCTSHSLEGYAQLFSQNQLNLRSVWCTTSVGACWKDNEL